MQHAKVAVRGLFSSLDARFRYQGGVGIATGIPCLDNAGGLSGAEVVVIAGHPGVGKTSLAVSVARHAAEKHCEVLYISLAETNLQIIERVMLAESSVRSLALRMGQLQRQDMTALTHAAALITQLPLHIEDAVDLTARGVRELVRTWRASHENRPALVIVDYLQLLADECDAAGALRTLVSTAKESSTAVLLVSQHLSDARERAALEGIATAVIYLRAEAGAHEILLTKHRHCQTPQTEDVVFDGSTFADAVPASG